MTVHPTGDSLRFHVSSDTGEAPDGYIVDLESMNGNGFCLCRDFACRCEPAYRHAGKIVNFGQAGRTRCKHINAALQYLGQMVVEKVRAK